MKPSKGLTSLMMATILLAAACTSGGSNDGQGVQVVVSTPVLGDVVSHIVGDSGEVTVLMPNGADPHDYVPSSSEVALIAEADLVVVNGLGLEEGLIDVLSELEADGANVLEVGEIANPVTLDGEPCLADVAGCDPHVWLDPLGMVPATRLISDRLTEIAPSAGWDERARMLRSEILFTHTEIAERFVSIRPEKRKLVTSHEFFGYFARRYIFESLGSVVPGGSTLAEPSPAHLSELVATMDAEMVDVIFVDGTESARLVESIGDSFDREISVVTLYVESLGEAGSGADTYVGMIRTNADLIIEALS